MRLFLDRYRSKVSVAVYPVCLSLCDEQPRHEGFGIYFLYRETSAHLEQFYPKRTGEPVAVLFALC